MQDFLFIRVASFSVNLIISMAISMKSMINIFFFQIINSHAHYITAIAKLKLYNKTNNETDFA